jgi:iron(III) transport system substrate-binding protein
MKMKFILCLIIVLFVSTAAMERVSGFASDQKLIDAAKKEGTLVIYHTLTRRVLKKVVQGFEKKYGIDVKWTRKGTGGITRMVTAELQAGALKCDIVSIGDPTTFLRWKKEGILKEYVTPSTPKFVEGFAEPEGWYSPSRVMYISLGYNTKRVSKDEVPKSWKDVLDPKWKGRLAIVDPRRSGPGRWWMGAIVSKFGWGYFEKLAKNKPLMVKSASAASLTLVNGEADLLAVAMENDMIQRGVKGAPVRAVYPQEGLIPKLSPVAICAKTAHPNAARLWIDWEHSVESQRLISKFGGYVPVRKDVKPFHPRESKMTDPSNLFGVNEEWFLKNKKKLMKKFSKIMAGKN